MEVSKLNNNIDYGTAQIKTLEGIEKVKEKTSKKRYKYYVLFEIDVTKDDVLFDINKVIYCLNF